jgi:hypothetical protein
MEGKPLAMVDHGHLCAKMSIANITAEVENDWRETRSGSWGDNQTSSPTPNKELKPSKKLAMWLPITEEQGDEKGASLGLQGIHRDFCCSLFTILDNVLTVGESARGEERAGWPHPHPGGLL